MNDHFQIDGVVRWALRKLTSERFEEILQAALANQRAEGYILSDEEELVVRCRLRAMIRAAAQEEDFNAR